MGDTDKEAIDTTGTEETVDTTGTEETTDTTIDAEAFAELISEKDKKIEQLEKDVKMLKKSNADLTVKVSAQNRPEKELGEVIVDFCDTRKIN